MKRLIVILVVCSLLFSCKNDDDSNNISNIEGTYIWVQSYGSIAGIILTPESTGNTAKLIVSENTITHYTNNELTFSYTYTVEVVNENGANYTLLVPDGDHLTLIFIENEENILIVTSDGNPDGFVNTYEKI